MNSSAMDGALPFFGSRCGLMPLPVTTIGSFSHTTQKTVNEIIYLQMEPDTGIPEGGKVHRRYHAAAKLDELLPDGFGSHVDH
jgi:hypothetical protein